MATRWCPSSLAKLVNITPVTMVYGRYNELVNGVYKPTNITGGHHPLWNSPNNTPFSHQNSLGFIMIHPFGLAFGMAFSRAWLGPWLSQGEAM